MVGLDTAGMQTQGSFTNWDFVGGGDGPDDIWTIPAGAMPILTWQANGRYCITPPALLDDFLRIHQFINFSTSTPMQYAIADFLDECPQHHRELAHFYQQKRDLFLQQMTASRFKLKPSAGTYFQLADYSAISDKADTEFAAWLTREHRVAAIPVSVFYKNAPDQKVVRFCFAKHDDTLREAVKRLTDL